MMQMKRLQGRNKIINQKGTSYRYLKPKEVEMMNSIIEFNDKLAREVMTPKVNVFAIDYLQPIDNYLPEIIEMKYYKFQYMKMISIISSEYCVLKTS